MESPTDGYDAGGILPAGVTVLASTMRPEVRLSPEQTRAFERCAEIVRRWEERER